MKKCSICEGKKNAVEMSKAGWKKLRKVNGELSERYIRVYILCGEVRAYLEGYEAAEMKLDTECQELRYDERTCLIVCKR